MRLSCSCSRSEPRKEKAKALGDVGRAIADGEIPRIWKAGDSGVFNRLKSGVTSVVSTAWPVTARARTSRNPRVAAACFSMAASHERDDVQVVPHAPLVCVFGLRVLRLAAVAEDHGHAGPVVLLLDVDDGRADDEHLSPH